MSKKEHVRLSIAKRVKEHLENRPYVLEALEKNIVNLSALSKAIKEELGIDSEYAIKAAVRRFSVELRKHTRKREERVLKVLKGSRITLTDKMKTLVSRKRLSLDSRLSISFDDTYVYVVDELKGSDDAENGILSTRENCGLFIVDSPPMVEETPGVIAYLTSVLSEQNINVVEFVSSYTFTILVIDKDDILRTYRILSNIIG